MRNSPQARATIPPTAYIRRCCCCDSSACGIIFCTEWKQLSGRLITQRRVTRWKTTADEEIRVLVHDASARVAGGHGSTSAAVKRRLQQYDSTAIRLQFDYSSTSAELTPVRIILKHCTPVLPVCPDTGGEDPAGRDRPGYELSRMIYGH